MNQTNKTKYNGTQKKRTKTQLNGLRPEKVIDLYPRKRHSPRFNLQRHTPPWYIYAYEIEKVLLRDHWNDTESLSRLRKIFALLSHGLVP